MTLNENRGNKKRILKSSALCTYNLYKLFVSPSYGRKETLILPCMLLYMRKIYAVMDFNLHAFVVKFIEIIIKIHVPAHV